MSELRIFGKALENQEVESLKALVAEAGFDPKEIDVVDLIGEPDPACEDEVILILATPATCAQADFEAQMAKVMNGTRRAIWVWPKDAAATELPEAYKKYTYSAVSWDAKKLASVIADDDVVCFELPNGQPMPKVKMEHNLCVEDPKKPKVAK